MRTTRFGRVRIPFLIVNRRRRTVSIYLFCNTFGRGGMDVFGCLFSFSVGGYALACLLTARFIFTQGLHIVPVCQADHACFCVDVDEATF